MKSDNYGKQNNTQKIDKSGLDKNKQGQGQKSGGIGGGHGGQTTQKPGTNTQLPKDKDRR